MGYKLFREVKTGAPAALTHREKLVAMVLGDDANDRTRLTHSSTVSPEILEQTMIKTDREMRKVLARLVDMKVLELAAGGHNGCTAKYRFLHISPDGCPGAPCRCPLSLAVRKEPATDPDETGTDNPVAGPETPANDETDEETDGPKRTGYDGVGGSFKSRSRSKKNLPTSSSSSTTNSTAAADTSTDKQQQSKKHAVADELTAAFWKVHGKGLAQSFLAVRAVIRTAIGNEVDRNQLARALDQVARDGKPISGGTLAYSIGRLRTTRPGGARSEPPTGDDIRNLTLQDVL
jgi:hypothetical protein